MSKNLYEIVYQKGVRAFHSERYEYSANCFRAAINLVEGVMTAELYGWVRMSHLYRDYKEKADELFGIELYEDAMVIYNDLVFGEAHAEIKERLYRCSKKAFLPYESQAKFGFKQNDRVTHPAQFDIEPFFREDRAVVVIGEKYGVIDRDGHTILPFEYDFIFPRFVSGLSPVRKNGKYGFINRNGQVVVDLKYDHAQIFNEELAVVQFNGKWGFIDSRGQIIIDFQYDDAFGFYNGLAPVKQGLKWGYINTDGEMMIFPVFQEAGSFSEGWAWVKYQNKVGYINQDGMVGEGLGFQFDEAYDFRMGMAIVKNEGEFFYINSGGYIIGTNQRMFMGDYESNQIFHLVNQTKQIVRYLR